MLVEEENEAERYGFYFSINRQPSFWMQRSVALMTRS